ncbi:histidine phosphotransferase family protein [Salipiger sp.]|uniref:histidine phosphotransferase family protein n=1 Tax=Salipiger sp. TaxID=2078585 RepID=UPI003A987F7D
MTNDSARIAGLVGSRICHDLVSPVGAISNGLELIALAGQPGAEEMALIAQSCSSATARINLFRMAFGAASSDQQIGGAEARKLLAGYCAGSRLSIDWQPSGDAERRDMQLAMLAVLCCESALPLGGKVTVAEEGDGWRVTGTGRRLQIEPEIWAMLSGGAMPEDLAPARVQFALLGTLAPEHGRKLEVTTGEAAVSVAIA